MLQSFENKKSGGVAGKRTPTLGGSPAQANATPADDVLQPNPFTLLQPQALSQFADGADNKRVFSPCYPNATAAVASAASPNHGHHLSPNHRGASPAHANSSVVSQPFGSQSLSTHYTLRARDAYCASGSITEHADLNPPDVHKNSPTFAKTAHQDVYEVPLRFRQFLITSSASHSPHSPKAGSAASQSGVSPHNASHSGANDGGKTTNSDVNGSNDASGVSTNGEGKRKKKRDLDYQALLSIFAECDAPTRTGVVQGEQACRTLLELSCRHLSEALQQPDITLDRVLSLIRMENALDSLSLAAYFEIMQIAVAAFGNAKRTNNSKSELRLLRTACGITLQPSPPMTWVSGHTQPASVGPKVATTDRSGEHSPDPIKELAPETLAASNLEYILRHPKFWKLTTGNKTNNPVKDNSRKAYSHVASKVKRAWAEPFKPPSASPQLPSDYLSLLHLGHKKSSNFKKTQKALARSGGDALMVRHQGHFTMDVFGNMINDPNVFSIYDPSYDMENSMANNQSFDVGNTIWNPNAQHHNANTNMGNNNTVSCNNRIPTANECYMGTNNMRNNKGGNPSHNDGFRKQKAMQSGVGHGQHGHYGYSQSSNQAFPKNFMDQVESTRIPVGGTPVERSSSGHTGLYARAEDFAQLNLQDPAAINEMNQLSNPNHSGQIQQTVMFSGGMSSGNSRGNQAHGATDSTHTMSPTLRQHIQPQRPNLRRQDTDLMNYEGKTMGTQRTDLTNHNKSMQNENGHAAGEGGHIGNLSSPHQAGGNVGITHGILPNTHAEFLYGQSLYLNEVNMGYSNNVNANVRYSTSQASSQLAYGAGGGMQGVSGMQQSGLGGQGAVNTRNDFAYVVPTGQKSQIARNVMNYQAHHRPGESYMQQSNTYIQGSPTKGVLLGNPMDQNCMVYNSANQVYGAGGGFRPSAVQADPDDGGYANQNIRQSGADYAHQGIVEDHFDVQDENLNQLNHQNQKRGIFTDQDQARNQNPNFGDFLRSDSGLSKAQFNVEAGMMVNEKLVSLREAMDREFGSARKEGRHQIKETTPVEKGTPNEASPMKFVSAASSINEITMQVDNYTNGMKNVRTDAGLNIVIANQLGPGKMNAIPLPENCRLRNLNTENLLERVSEKLESFKSEQGVVP